MKNRYKVMTGDTDGRAWINDTLKTVGDEVLLTSDEAKYLLLAGVIDYHPLDHDKDGTLGGMVARPPSIADITVPAQPATPTPAPAPAPVATKPTEAKPQPAKAKADK